MLTPQQVLDNYYLEARSSLLEIAALLDRYDAALERDGRPAGEDGKHVVLRRALFQLADSSSPHGGQTKALLELFSEI